MGSLAEYRSMRDFGRTREPKGKVSRSAGPLRFFVQRHAATRLHYDFRLELDGVLKSWAVPKGPSLDPSQRRLAVHVEDHPMEYGSFEGTIPKGSYGAGTVVLWDRGTWTPIGDPGQGYEKGHLAFRLDGEKLAGTWNLVRIGEEKNWLLIKKRDETASTEDIIVSRPESVAAAVELPEVEFQLATAVKTPPAGKGWIHEIKLDGYRVMARIASGQARLGTRGGQDWTAKWPAVVRALERLPVHHAILDGEIVVLDKNGVSDFAALAAGSGHAVYFAFDLLHADGEDLRPKPLIERKARLSVLLAGAAPAVRYLEHLDAPFLERACGLGLEGIVSKRADGKHRPGRGDQWTKTKCLQHQEFVVVGWTPPGGSRTGLGALLLATGRSGKLVFAGRVGTGFDERGLGDLSRRLRGLSLDRPPVEADPKEGNWVRPELVVEVAFTGWTEAGRLRHPVFKGLRADKPAKEVEAEVVRISNRGRVIDEKSGLRKGDLAEYYEAVADRILPGIVGRPLAVVRCPDGIAKACFFQKHVGPGFPAAVKPFEEGMVIHDVQGLLSLVQFGVLEFHAWGAREDRPDRPDRIVLDLDPDPALPWSAVVRAARRVREILDALGLVSFVRHTGGKGLHVVFPILRRFDWETVRSFARGVAVALATESPDRYVATLSKSRRVGKIFVDYLRNGKGATAIASWSTRARPGIPVAVPVAWDELDGLAGGFGVAEAVRRPAGWEGFAEVRQSLPR